MRKIKKTSAKFKPGRFLYHVCRRNKIPPRSGRRMYIQIMTYNYQVPVACKRCSTVVQVDSIRVFGKRVLADSRLQVSRS